MNEDLLENPSLGYGNPACEGQGPALQGMFRIPPLSINQREHHLVGHSASTKFSQLTPEMVSFVIIEIIWLTANPKWQNIDHDRP